MAEEEFCWFFHQPALDHWPGPGALQVTLAYNGTMLLGNCIDIQIKELFPSENLKELHVSQFIKAWHSCPKDKARRGKEKGCFFYNVANFNNFQKIAAVNLVSEKYSWWLHSSHAAQRPTCWSLSSSSHVSTLCHPATRRDQTGSAQRQPRTWLFSVWSFWEMLRFISVAHKRRSCEINAPWGRETLPLSLRKNHNF